MVDPALGARDTVYVLAGSVEWPRETRDPVTSASYRRPKGGDRGLRNIARGVPLGRAEEIGDLVWALAEATYMTESSVAVDGGLFNSFAAASGPRSPALSLHGC